SQQMLRFFAYPAAQFDHRDGRWKKTRNLTGIQPQQTLVGARQPVLGKMRDGFKQRAAQFIVEILGVQLFLRLCEASAHVGREFAYSGVVLDLDRGSRSPAGKGAGSRLLFQTQPDEIALRWVSACPASAHRRWPRRAL